MKPSYRAAWLLLLAPACGNEPPPASGDEYLSVEQLMDPESCKECHPNQYRDWSGSMHAYAADDPLFLAMNKQGQKEAQIGTFCVNCHAPMAVAVGATTDGLNLASLPKKYKGVTCYFCHAVDDVTSSHNNGLHLASDGVMRGQFNDPVPNKAHRAAYSQLHDRNYLQSAAVCGSCHDIENGHGAPLERTYGEWQSSVYATQTGRTCNQCHMTTRANETAAQAPGVFLRNVDDHKFPGVDLALTEWPEAATQRAAVESALNTTLRSAVCVQGADASSKIVVIVDNLGAGHHWPSGATQDRRAWFEITARDADGSILYQSGAVPAGTEPAKLEGDDDFWLLRDCMFDAQGKEVHTFWDAATVETAALGVPSTFDISKVEAYLGHVKQVFPRDAAKVLPKYPAQVTLRVWLQAFPLDLFDELFQSPESEGFTAAQVASMRAKLAPMKVHEQIWNASDPKNEFVRNSNNPITMLCASDRQLSGGLQSTPAVRRTKCKP